MGWLRRLRDRRRPRLAAIYLAEAAGMPMRRVGTAVAIADAGLAGDRYATDCGHWRATDGCQVTLIQSEHLARAERRSGIPLSAGEHRRNLVIDGLGHMNLRRRTLRIGSTVLEWHRTRPPCGYLEQIAGRGIARALGRHSGHCVRVRVGGELRIGDVVIVLD